MAALDFMTMATSLEDDSLVSRCGALSCWPITAFECARALQARMPSYHVCPEFSLPAAPQFPNQEPPRPQQLVLPDLWIVPHLTHNELMVVVLTGLQACTPSDHL